jgi:hypothetical protein
MHTHSDGCIGYHTGRGLTCPYYICIVRFMTISQLTARQILEAAEADLRALIPVHANSQDYTELRVTLDFAEGVASLLGVRSESSGRTAVQARQSASKSSPPKSKARRTAKSKYPQFVCSNGHLVKIGWAKKSKAEYSHKAPIPTVHAFVNHLLRNVSRGEQFKMEDVLPVTLPDGTEIPTYQPYLTLKWLQECKAVTKHGRDGYEIDTSAVENGRLEDLINATRASGSVSKRKSS